LGCRLKRFLFEPFSEEMVAQIQDVIIESLNYWLPFVLIRYIDVKMSDNMTADSYSKLKISVAFSLEQDPGTQESIELTIGGGGE
jgi:phage baseplate assembly protein W